MKIEKEIDSFELENIFDCGQCFRWFKQEDNSYIGFVKNMVVKVKKENDKTIFITNDNIDKNEFETNIIKYFDLKRNYKEIKDNLSNVDENLKNAIDFGNGIRILNQDLFETIISFIISANNNIPRITGIINRLSKKYGMKITFENIDYYSFPSIEKLKDCTIEDFRNLGMGFRDKYVYSTIQKINNNEIDLQSFYNMETPEIRENLLKLSGVGPKVADCILLFSDLKKFDVFPIDVWVRRVMNDLYIHNSDEKKVEKREIQKIANDKFGKYEGLAQQYLFYWKREQ